MKFPKICRSYQDISQVIKYLTGAPLDKPISIDVTRHKEKRSLSANALSHVWYQDIARARGETPDRSKCFCKLHFGVPILRAESESFRTLYDKGIKPYLSYEDKLEAMRILPVTSLMADDQMMWYLRDMQMTLSQEENIILMSPNDCEYEQWSQMP